MRLLGALLLTGCSLDLDFHSEATTIHADGEDGRTHVSICAGPSELLSCNGEEAFEVALGDEIVPATQGLLSFGVQSAFFGTNEAGAEVTVTRVRDGATARATLPEPFTLSGPASTDVLRRGDSFELTWDPAGGSIIMELTLTCDSTSYFGDEIRIDDDGSQVVSTSGYPEGEPGMCRGAVTLTRTRDGSIDDRFPEGSYAEGRQERFLGFVLLN